MLKILQIVFLMIVLYFYINIDSVFEYTAKWFAYALIARNPKHIERIKEYSFLADYLTAQQLNEMGMMLGFNAEIESDFLSDYVTTIAVNTTEVPFILPTCGLYIVHLRGTENIVLPVTPNKAIVFVGKEDKDNIVHDGIVHLIRVDRAKDIITFNRQAAYSQLYYGNGYIVSPDRGALEIALQESKKMIADAQ